MGLPIATCATPAANRLCRSSGGRTMARDDLDVCDSTVRRSQGLPDKVRLPMMLASDGIDAIDMAAADCATTADVPEPAWWTGRDREQA
jgi:hypothetical protein